VRDWNARHAVAEPGVREFVHDNVHLVRVSNKAQPNDETTNIPMFDRR
jgi:hypothetical protein